MSSRMASILITSWARALDSMDFLTERDFLGGEDFNGEVSSSDTSLIMRFVEILDIDFVIVEDCEGSREIGMEVLEESNNRLEL